MLIQIPLLIMSESICIMQTWATLGSRERHLYFLISSVSAHDPAHPGLFWVLSFHAQALLCTADNPHFSAAGRHPAPALLVFQIPARCAKAKLSRKPSLTSSLHGGVIIYGFWALLQVLSLVIGRTLCCDCLSLSRSLPPACVLFSWYKPYFILRFVNPEPRAMSEKEEKLSECLKESLSILVLMTQDGVCSPEVF